MRPAPSKVGRRGINTSIQHLLSVKWLGLLREVRDDGLSFWREKKCRQRHEGVNANDRHLLLGVAQQLKSRLARRCGKHCRVLGSVYAFHAMKTNAEKMI